MCCREEGDGFDLGIMVDSRNGFGSCLDGTKGAKYSMSAWAEALSGLKKNGADFFISSSHLPFSPFFGLLFPFPFSTLYTQTRNPRSGSIICKLLARAPCRLADDREAPLCLGSSRALVLLLLSYVTYCILYSASFLIEATWSLLNTLLYVCREKQSIINPTTLASPANETMKPWSAYVFHSSLARCLELLSIA